MPRTKFMDGSSLLSSFWGSLSPRPVKMSREVKQAYPHLPLTRISRWNSIGLGKLIFSFLDSSSVNCITIPEPWDSLMRWHVKDIILNQLLEIVKKKAQYVSINVFWNVALYITVFRNDIYFLLSVTVHSQICFFFYPHSSLWI